MNKMIHLLKTDNFTAVVTFQFTFFTLPVLRHNLLCVFLVDEWESGATVEDLYTYRENIQTTPIKATTTQP